MAYKKLDEDMARSQTGAAVKHTGGGGTASAGAGRAALTKATGALKGVGRAAVTQAAKQSAAKPRASSKKRTASGGSAKQSGSTAIAAAPAYQAAPASAYYNQRGDEVRRYQQYLNGLGESLKVDGIWGPNTEAAYQRNRAAFDQWRAAGQTGLSGGYNAGGVDSHALKALIGAYRLDSPYERSEEELRRAARDQYAAQYESDARAAILEGRARQQSVAEQLSALMSELEARRAETGARYAGQGAALQRMLTARGMGRSTYAGDVQRNYDAQLSGALEALNDQYARQAARLNAQGAQYARDTAGELAQLMRDRQRGENALYNQLYEAQASRRAASDAAYNDIVSALMALLSDNDYRTRALAQRSVGA